MSSSSSYEPDDEDGSESDFERRDRASTRRSSPSVAAQTISSSSLRAGSAEEPEVNVSQSRYAWLWSRIEKIPPGSLEAYTGLLSEIENDMKFAAVKEGDEIHKVTQNGAVVWTATEKEVLFNVLDRKGKNGIKEIAAAIGTKSELEVMEHLGLLHRSLQYQHLLERHTHSIIMGDIPAATEIGKECCDLLDEYAAMLVVKEEAEEAAVGRKKHGNHWIITDAQAQKLAESKNDDTAARGGVFLAAGLLNVPVMLNCSRRLFMNSGGPRIEDNWTNLVTSEKESPSLTADALLDFYALTVSITRRLIQSSQFFAMARLRSTRRPGRERINAVRKRDVQTALDVLNMKRDRSDFWITLPRRNSLEVADIQNRKGWIPRVFNYNEVEDILRGDDDYFQQVSKHGTLPDDDQQMEAKHTDNEDRDQSVSVSRASSELSSPRSESDEIPPDPEIEHANSLDNETSRREELELWNMLGQPAPFLLDAPIKTEDDDNHNHDYDRENDDVGDDGENEDTSRKPQAERKTKQDLVDWRDRTLYRSEWEEYGYDVHDLEDDLAENRRKRRRIEGFPLEESSSSFIPSQSDVFDNEVDEEEEDAGEHAESGVGEMSQVFSDEEHTDMAVDADVDVDEREAGSPGDSKMDPNPSSSSRIGTTKVLDEDETQPSHWSGHEPHPSLLLHQHYHGT